MTEARGARTRIPTDFIRSAARPRGGQGARALAVAVAVVGALGLLPTSFAEAQAVISVSPDITIPLGAGNLVTVDHAVAADNQLGIVALQSLGAIPESADVVGYAEGGGVKLLSFDVTVVPPGGPVVHPGDVVAWNGSSYSIVFDAALAGVPRGVQTDAIAVASNGGLVLSFDTDVSLPGALHVADEDLVRWNGSAFSLALDGSSAGMSRALDVDAVDDLGGSVFLVSFDSGGTVGSVSFADEDVLRHVAGAWSLERDGSAADADWGAADLDAMQMVPEPGDVPMLAAGLLLLAGLAARLRRLRGAARDGTRSAVPCVGVAVAALLAAPMVQASDGVLEINQSCAQTGGCFPGDTAGLPVTITASGSYRLSSNLVVANENTDGIVVNASHVRIDLAGFAISGPVVCTGTPIACTPSAGTGSGVERTSSLNRGIHVEHGTIRGMGNRGVLLGEQATVVDLRVGSNRVTGIEVAADSVVEGSIAFLNGGSGIFAAQGTVVTNVVSARNADQGAFFSGSVSSAGLVVSRSSFYQNEGSGLLSAGASTITRNTLYDNGVNGMSAGSGSVVSGNIMFSNGDTGLSNNSASAIAYTDNTITGNAQNVPPVIGSGLINMGGNSCDGTTTCP